MTKKEVVATLRKAFNDWASLLPDIEYKTCNDNSEIFSPETNIQTLHTLELGAEEAEGGTK